MSVASTPNACCLPSGRLVIVCFCLFALCTHTHTHTPRAFSDEHDGHTRPLIFLSAWCEKASNDLAEIDKRNMGEPNRIEESMELVETNLEVRTCVQ